MPYMAGYFDGANAANKRNGTIIRVKDKQIRDLEAINAGLQQSLDEANARIDELTAKPAFPFKVGDKVRSHKNAHESAVYTVVRVNKDLRLLDVKSNSGYVYRDRSIDLFYKVS